MARPTCRGVPGFLALILLVDPLPASAAGRATDSPASQPASVAGAGELRSCLRLRDGRPVKVTLKSPSSLAELVAWISSMTCKRFIVGASLPAQPVTLIAPTPITAGEAYRAFLSALEVMGLTVVPAGGALKVVPSNWAPQSAIPTYRDDERGLLPGSDQVVTQIVRLREAKLAEILPVLHKLKSRAGDVASYPPTGTLILTDHGSNLRRMLKILAELDVSLGDGRIWVVRPRFADAGDLAKLLGELFASASGGLPTLARAETAPAASEAASGPTPPTPRVIADPGANAIVIVASEPVYARMLAVIRALDSESAVTRAETWVHRLQHGDAEGVARSLSGLGLDGARPGRRAGGTSGTVTPFEGQIKITADKAQNALLILASLQDYLRLRRMLKELDQPRRQVLIEAYILELRIDGDRSLGFSYHGGGQQGSGDKTTILGTLGHGDLSSLLGVPLTGLSLGVLGPALQGSGALLGKDANGNTLPDVPSFGIVFQALQSRGDLNVLSAPHLLTTDAEDAELHIGKNIPVRRGASLPTGADKQLSLLASLVPPAVEYKELGLRLKLTPTIGAGDTIRLRLRQEVSDVLEKDFGGLGASTSQKLMNTYVTLLDRQTIAIGGLMEDQQAKIQSKVPILGDLPILGRLFRRERVTTVKTNLLVVLTPTIVKDALDLRRILRRKLRERQEFLRRYTSWRERRGLLPVDFSYKRGLLGEIHAFGAELEEEARLAREEARARTAEGPRSVAPELPAASRPAPR
jgi:general secretion pathway protein D